MWKTFLSETLKHKISMDFTIHKTRQNKIKHFILPKSAVNPHPCWGALLPDTPNQAMTLGEAPGALSPATVLVGPSTCSLGCESASPAVRGICPRSRGTQRGSGGRSALPQGAPRGRVSRAVAR